MTKAKHDGGSPEAEIPMLLRDAVDRGSRTSLREFADQIAALTPEVSQTDGTDLVREDRAR
jgi:hypothetical protein